MRIIGFILFVLVIGACTKSEFCIEPNAASLRIAFKTYDSTDVLVDTALKNVDVYSTDTTAALVENRDELTQIDVFPNRRRTQQTYIVFHSNERDTIEISYTNEENFISNGCGYQTFFRIEEVSFSKSRIDSVNITETLVTDEISSNHLEVIYK